MGKGTRFYFVTPQHCCVIRCAIFSESNARKAQAKGERGSVIRWHLQIDESNLGAFSLHLLPECLLLFAADVLTIPSTVWLSIKSSNATWWSRLSGRDLWTTVSASGSLSGGLPAAAMGCLTRRTVSEVRASCDTMQRLMAQGRKL
jgi:hypothetical protein